MGSVCRRGQLFGVGLIVLVVALAGAGPGGAAPSNDNLANAIVLTASGGSLTTDNTGATKESGEHDHAGDRGGASLWYTWTPNFTGTASIDTSGSVIDTLLAVYGGTSVSDPAPAVASNDDVGEAGGASRVCFSVLAFTTYRIAVDGYDDDEGPITMTYGPKTDSGVPCPTRPPIINGGGALKPGALKPGFPLLVGGSAYADAGAFPTITRTWERCIAELCDDIATGDSYTVQAADVGAAIRVHETLTQPSGSASNDSDPTAGSRRRRTRTAASTS